MSIRLRFLVVLMVEAYTALWIEMLLQSPNEKCKLSRLIQPCGLKCIQVFFLRRPVMSRLIQPCGLKFARMEATVSEILSRLIQPCGLKYATAWRKQERS